MVNGGHWVPGAMNVAPTPGTFHPFGRLAGALRLSRPSLLSSSRKRGSTPAIQWIPTFVGMTDCVEHPRSGPGMTSFWAEGMTVISGVYMSHWVPGAIGFFGRHECRPYNRHFPPILPASRGVASFLLLPFVILAKAGIHSLEEPAQPNSSPLSFLRKRESSA